MASVKVMFRASTVSAKQGVIYYQVIHNRVVRQLTTDYHIFSNEWDYLIIDYPLLGTDCRCPEHYFYTCHFCISFKSSTKMHFVQDYKFAILTL